MLSMAADLSCSTTVPVLLCWKPQLWLFHTFNQSPVRVGSLQHRWASIRRWPTDGLTTQAHLNGPGCDLASAGASWVALVPVRAARKHLVWRYLTVCRLTWRDRSSSRLIPDSVSTDSIRLTRVNVGSSVRRPRSVRLNNNDRQQSPHTRVSLFLLICLTFKENC